MDANMWEDLYPARSEGHADAAALRCRSFGTCPGFARVVCRPLSHTTIRWPGVGGCVGVLQRSAPLMIMICLIAVIPIRGIRHVPVQLNLGRWRECYHRPDAVTTGCLRHSRDRGAGYQRRCPGQSEAASFSAWLELVGQPCGSICAAGHHVRLLQCWSRRWWCYVRTTRSATDPSSRGAPRHPRSARRTVQIQSRCC